MLLYLYKYVCPVKTHIIILICFDDFVNPNFGRTIKKYCLKEDTDMEKTALLFPGQGAQSAGMGKETAEKYTDLKMSVFGVANDILGFDLEKLCFEGTADELSRTIVSQPAIMAVSLLMFEAKKREGLVFSAVAGHSLGEYAAMAVSGMLSYENAFKAIKLRSEAMQRAAESFGGSMYAIIGPSAEEVERVCGGVSGYAVPVNYNSPVQTVIAGEDGAAAEAAAELSKNHKAKAIKLGVGAAFHSSFMQRAAEEFKAELLKRSDEITFGSPSVRFYSNLTGAELIDFSDMPSKLAEHIVSPVRFVSELFEMSKAGYDNFIECGPGKVLTGLVRKTLNK